TAPSASAGARKTPSGARPNRKPWSGPLHGAKRDIVLLDAGFRVLAAQTNDSLRSATSADKIRLTALPKSLTLRTLDFSRAVRAHAGRACHALHTFNSTSVLLASGHDSFSFVTRTLRPARVVLCYAASPRVRLRSRTRFRDARHSRLRHEQRCEDSLREP